MFLRISFFPLALHREDPEIESNNTLHNKVKIIESNIERCVKWIFTWNWVRCSEIAKAYTSRPSCRPCNHVFLAISLQKGIDSHLPAQAWPLALSTPSPGHPGGTHHPAKVQIRWNWNTQSKDKDLTNWMQITSPSPTSDSRESSFSPT